MCKELLLLMKTGGLAILFYTYKQVLPTLDGYLINDAQIDIIRVQKFFAALVEHEKVFIISIFI